MYKKELDNLIKQNRIPKAILLYGESDYLIGHYGGLIASQYGPREEHKKFYFSDYDYEACKNILGQSSLFGDKNIVLIKTDKKIPKKDAEAFFKLVQANDDSYLIVEHYKSPTKNSREYSSDTKAMSTLFGKKNGADSVRFFHPNQGESIHLLAQESKRLGVHINNHVLGQLLIIQNMDIALAMNELQKFTLFEREIGLKDLEQLSYGLGGIASEDTIIDILEKKDVRASIQRLLEMGEDEIQLLNAISNFISQLLLFYLYIKVYGHPNSKEILGYPLPKFIEEKRASLAIQFNAKIYQAMLMQIQSTTLVIKTQKNVDKNALFYACLIKLQALIK